MPVFEVTTGGGSYLATVERGVAGRVRDFLPPRHGAVFIVTEERIWHAHGRLLESLNGHVLMLPGGEENKRFAPVEALAEQMVKCGADRTSVVVAFGGGIVNDMTGFLAAIFMRGISVVQVPTTLLAQVDAAVGGKTGVNLASGKNLIGSFHQPQAVIIDPALLSTLPDREYRAGLYECIKCGVIASPWLFELLKEQRQGVLDRDPALVDQIISECVRIKAEVVSADERESGLRRILNFGHTIGHAIEAETRYCRFLHGEAVALGMRGAAVLARLNGMLSDLDLVSILGLIRDYGPVPAAADLRVLSIFDRLHSDKKTMQGKLHFVLPTRIGATEVVSDLPQTIVLAAIREALV